MRVIFALANPQDTTGTYENHRHNVGVWFIQKLAAIHNCQFKKHSKIHGYIANFEIFGKVIYLVRSSHYMNNNGQTVAAVLKYYKLNPNEMLVAHDELDFEVAKIKLKYSGGAGGHNGLASITSHIGTKDFYRLRIGIGKPLNKNMVSKYVLSAPSNSQKEVIHKALDDVIIHSEYIFSDIQKATLKINTQ